ncbi:MAG TPA: DNA gyrase inhibitor YacG [Gammaproteobacteria bacterium]|jgi:endogenous inhibitor of DNA gyrase (YacG/DUF329 family)|nr:DNA gyrase inhibitor YacG [Gammaproteobacteria bacterium]
MPLIPCPRCGKKQPWTTENPFRPFCSERCKLIDLGNWASEKYNVPGEAVDKDKKDKEDSDDE